MKGMSKQQDTNFLKIQICVLKVNVHCDGCKQKVKKLLHKIDGVYTVTVDSEQGKVTVSGNVNPATLIKKLAKSGKHAELLASKPNNNQKQQQAVANGGKGQQQNQKGCFSGGGGGKDRQTAQLLASLPSQQQQQLQLQQLQQIKGCKDLKLPNLKDLKFPFQKDPKSAKFALPPGEEGSDFDAFDDYSDDDDDDDFDDMDCFDVDFDDDFKMLKINKPMSGNVGGNAKKVQIPVQNKGKSGNYDPKNINGGKRGGVTDSNNNLGGGGKNGNVGKSGGGPQYSRNGGSNNNSKTKNAPNGNGENTTTKGGGVGKNDLGGVAHPKNHPNHNLYPNMMMMGQNFRGMGPQHPMGNVPAAVQGLPAGTMPPGYFQGQVAAAAANPYQQQQYMQAMMQQRQLQQQQQQQQQQRMMIMNGQDQMYHYQPMMGYPQPPLQAMYMPPQPQSEPYTHFFSDENPNSCSIM